MTRRRTSPERSSMRPVARAHDPAEQQAERAADVVARGGSVSGWSFSTVPASAGVQRQEVVKEKTDEEKKQEAVSKTVQAVQETPQAKALKERVLADPLVKTVKDAVTSTPGMIATGVAAAGGVAALGAAKKPLPFQPPAIPLDRITPGLSAQVKYEGPVNAPTFVGLTLTYKEQGPKGKKTAQSDQIAADIARLKAQEQMFKPAGQKQEEQELVDAWIRSQSGLPGLKIPLKGTPKKEEDAPKKDEEQTPVQRAPASPSASPPAHADVGPALDTPGRPLDARARRSMETRFGYDFSGVRVHDDARAGATAASIEASAFTVGEDVVFAPGRYDPASPDGRRLLAHELAHVVQQSRGGENAIQRAPQAAPAPAVRRDYEEFVDEAIRYLGGARDHYRATAQAARVPGPSRAPAQPQRPAAPERAPQPTGPAAPRPVPRMPQAPPGLTPERLHTVLEGLLRTYESSRTIITDQLAGDAARLDRLARAYTGAADAARSAAAGQGRTNLVFIAAPKEQNDLFITNATTYARLYFAGAQQGDTVHMQEQIASPDELFDAIETTEPDRMIRRIDIFCHGTIEPTHQIKFGTTWFRVDQIQAAAAARARSGRTLQNQTRFDGSTVIELHACRLGAPTAQPGRSGMAATHGDDFLRGFGESVGGGRGEQVTGYVQRWVPRRFSFPGVRSTSRLSGRQARLFDRIAVQTFDAVMAGSVELQSQLTDAEKAPGYVFSEARKIEIMRHLYDAAGGAWLIGHQYSTERPQSTDPVRDRPRARDTFTNEKDWTHLVLNVRVPATSGPGAATP